MAKGAGSGLSKAIYGESIICPKCGMDCPEVAYDAHQNNCLKK
jgi:hypothetical protein